MFSSRLRRARRGEFGPRLKLQFLEERVTPTTFVVSNLLDGPVTKAGNLPGSLRQAIFDANANPGADVVDATGVTGTIVLAAGELRLTEGLELHGSGATNIAISGNSKSRVIDINQTSNVLSSMYVVQDFTITQGTTNYRGGGLYFEYVNANVTLNRVAIVNNKATGNGYGGGIASNALLLTINDSTINFNSAGGTGGGIYCDTARPLVVSNSTISFNSALGTSSKYFSGGGAISMSGNGKLSHCVVEGNSATGAGGGIRASWLTLSNSLIHNNKVVPDNGYLVYGGGGVFCDFTLIANQCAFEGNQAESLNGGGIYVRISLLQLSQCAISKNSATGSSALGGGIYSFASRVLVEQSTLSGNTATLKGGGFHGGSNSSSTFDIKNSTISGNSSAMGGGLYWWFSKLNLQSTTITANQASQGGGVFSATDLVVQSTIIADNQATSSAPDIVAPRVTARDSCFSSVVGITQVQNEGGLLLTSAKLGPLADNGGGLLTHLPDAGSFVRGTGSNPGELLTDQRGQPRLTGNRVDIGAVESFDPTPTAIVAAKDLVALGQMEYIFTVTFDDPDQIDVASIIGNSEAVEVTGPNGFSQDVQFVSIDDPSSGVTRTATYRILAPVGKFGPPDNGGYDVAIQPNQVFDKTGLSVAGGVRTQFKVFIPSQFVVTSTLDGPVTKAGDLPGSLRQAIFDANVAPTTDSISFDKTVFASSQTIELAAGTLNISDSVHLIAPGQDLLTIDAVGKSRGFYLSGVFGFQNTVSMSGLSITNGLVTYGAGGGIYAFNANLVMEKCAIYGNASYDGYSTYVGGGGVYVNSSMAKIIDCQFFDNSSNQFGGGMRIDAYDITIENTEFHGNTSSKGGGGVYLSGSSINVIGSHVTNNQALSGSAGGIYVRDVTSMAIQGSVISGNLSLSDSGGGGGGIYLYKGKSLAVTDTLISGNATLSTGGFAGGGGLHFRNLGTSYVPNNSSQVSIVRSRIVGNLTEGSGAGLLFGANQTVSIQDSTIDGNIAGQTGGGIYFGNRLGFLIDRSTISNNVSEGSSTPYGLGGGGIYFRGFLAQANPTIRQSTISGNSSKSNGGAIVLVNAEGTLRIENSTIVQNAALANGGGITLQSGTMSLALTSTIIANNVNAATPDIFTTGQVTADHSLIGVTNGITTLTATASLTGTLAALLDPLLAPLADNGGPTKTHVPLPGSPAINQGSNPLNLTYDQRGPGYPRQAGVAPDIGAFEFPLPPVVNAFTVDDGSQQRSMVRSVTMTFSEAVTFPFGVPAAFQLQRTGPGGPTGLVNLAIAQVGNVVTLTFDDPVLAPSPGKSLIDGNYSLTLIAAKIQGAAGLLDGNGDGIPGGNQSTTFHRLFGDSNGDRRVTSIDYNAFRIAWATNNTTFDFNNDGIITAVDFSQFRLRYGVVI